MKQLFGLLTALSGNQAQNNARVPFRYTNENFVEGIFDKSNLENHREVINWLIHLFGSLQGISTEELPDFLQKDFTWLLEKFQGNFGPLGQTYTSENGMYRYESLRGVLQKYATESTLLSDGLAFSSAEFKRNWKEFVSKVKKALNEMDKESDEGFLILVSVIKSISTGQYVSQNPFAEFKNSQYGQHCLRCLGESDFHDLWLLADKFRIGKDASHNALSDAIIGDLVQDGKEYKVFFALRLMVLLKQLPKAFIRVATIDKSVESMLSEEGISSALSLFILSVADMDGATQSLRIHLNRYSTQFTNLIGTRGNNLLRTIKLKLSSNSLEYEQLASDESFIELLEIIKLKDELKKMLMEFIRVRH